MLLCSIILLSLLTVEGFNIVTIYIKIVITYFNVYFNLH